MVLKWNLKPLFVSNDAFYEEIKKIRQLLTNIKQYEKIALDDKTMLAMLNEKWYIKELTNNLLVYGSLRYYQNIKDDERLKMKQIAENFSNQVNVELTFIDRKILALGKEMIDSFLKQNTQLTIYRLSLDNLFRMQEHVQDSQINEVISNNLNDINNQLALYNNILKDIKYGEIEIDGQISEITAATFGKYLALRNRDIRKQVYLTVNRQFQKEEEKFAQILNRLFDDRVQNAQLAGYRSVLEKVLFEENIDSKIIDVLIKTVNDNLYLMQQYLTIKAQLLNIDKPHLYDFSVPIDNNLPIQYSLEEAINIIKKALKPLGNEYLDVFEYLLDGHIDAEISENKHQSITFSWNTYTFMNFQGSYVDLKNLAHEIGHIVNYYLSQKNLPFLYEDSTIFVGEVAAIVNEILLNKYLYDNAQTDEERIFYLSKEIDNFVTSVFKQTMYTELEKDLYNLKLLQPLSVHIVSECYTKLLKKYYGNNVIYDDESGIEWTRLGHIYRWSYYPYKYATGLMIASNVVNALLNDKTLLKEQYIQFLSSGSSMYSLELLKILNIDLTNYNIMENGFNVLRKDIDKLKKILSLRK